MSAAKEGVHPPAALSRPHHRAKLAALRNGDPVAVVSTVKSYARSRRLHLAEDLCLTLTVEEIIDHLGIATLGRDATYNHRLLIKATLFALGFVKGLRGTSLVFRMPPGAGTSGFKPPPIAPATKAARTSKGSRRLAKGEHVGQVPT